MLRKALTHEVGAGGGECAGSSGLGDGADCTDSQGDAKQSYIVVIDLVAQTGVAGLVESLKPIEAGRVAVRHDQAMKENGEPSLAEALDLAGLAKNLGARRNQNMLAVVGVDIASEKAFDRSGELPVEAVE